MVTKRLSVMVLAVLVAGCAAVMTNTRRHEELGVHLRQGDWRAALQTVEQAREEGAYPHKDRLLYLLDLGMLHHYAGNHRESNRYLEQAEHLMEELFTASVSRAALSMMLNDNVLEYRGEDYEDIYVNVFKALNFIALGQHEEALVEVRRIDLKLRLLDDKYGQWLHALNQDDKSKINFSAPSSEFHNDALGRYLGALLYYHAGHHDDARIEVEHYHRALLAQPQIYPDPAVDLSLTALDTTLLHVVAFTGVAPAKTAVNFRIHTGKNHLLVFPERRGIHYAERFTWEGLADSYYFKFAVPELQVPTSRVQRVIVLANGQLLGTLPVVERLTRVAETTFARHRTVIYLKSIVRTVLKGLAGRKIKQQFAEREEEDEEEDKSEEKQEDKSKERRKEKRGNIFTKWLVAAAVDVATELTEQADLRTWRTMPGVAHAGYFPLAPGTHEIEVQFLDAQQRTVARQSFAAVEIKRDQLQALEATCLW